MTGFKLFAKKQTNTNITSTVTVKTLSPCPSPASLDSTPSSGISDAAEPTFQDMKLNQFLLSALSSVSIRHPTNIQKACIPAILKGLNVIGSSRTGSGKTATFALPILQKLSADPYGIFALILTPTRELAFQIAEQFRVFGDGINVKLAVVTGGMSKCRGGGGKILTSLDMIEQSIQLNARPHIVIATPGRLVDHIQSSTSDALHFSKLKFLVLDEADRLFEDSFAPDLEAIMDTLSGSSIPRQTLLFSATMTSTITQLASSKPDTVVWSETDR